jgi:hypothetical protein
MPIPGYPPPSAALAAVVLGRGRMMGTLTGVIPKTASAAIRGYVTGEHPRTLAESGSCAGRTLRRSAACRRLARWRENRVMSAEDLEKYEAEMELQLYREYRDVVGLFTHVVETERRFYLTNDVDLQVRSTDNGEVFFEVTMQDAWVWDMYRPARFVKNVRVVTFKDVNIEELAKSDLELPEDKPGFSG